MLLFDLFPERQQDYSYSESFLRAALTTNQRAPVPELLRHLGNPLPYRYRKDVTRGELQRAILNAFVMVRVAGQDRADGHVVLVEEISDDFVALRDPLPEAQGSAYRISLNVFLTAWQAKKTGLGQAILVE